MIQIEVEEAFVRHAQHMFLSGGWRRRENADALLFEWELERNKIVQRPLNWRHDFIYNGMKVDAKEVNGKWFNIHPLKYNQTKLEQYKESINIGDLTHFLFYFSDRDDTVVLKAGDIVTITPYSLCDAKKIWKSAKPSYYENCEAYVTRETIEILGEENETILEDLERMCGNPEQESTRLPERCIVG